MPVDVDLSKLSIIRAQLSEDNFVQGLYEAGKDIEQLASQLAPKDTEELANSGRVEVVGNKVIVSFGNDLPDDRAPAQEFGTVEMPAQPYFTPAIRAVDILFHVKKRLGFD